MTNLTHTDRCISDRMAYIMVSATGFRPGYPASKLIERLHRADADGMFDLDYEPSLPQLFRLAEEFAADYLS